MSTFLLLTFKYGKYDIIHASMPFILCFFWVKILLGTCITNLCIDSVH